MKSPRFLTTTVLFCTLTTALSCARATETENHGLRVLAKPGPVAIDGRANDWGLSGGVFACGDLDHLRDKSSVWLHTMYDADNFYVLARWKDETPLNNPESLGGHGFNGDCLQFCAILFPDAPNETITWWDAWRDSQGRSVVGRASAGKVNGMNNNIVPDLANTLDVGVKQAFQEVIC